MSTQLRSPSPFCPHFTKEWEEVKDASGETTQIFCHGCSFRPWETAAAMNKGVA